MIPLLFNFPIGLEIKLKTFESLDGFVDWAVGCSHLNGFFAVLAGIVGHVDLHLQIGQAGGVAGFVERDDDVHSIHVNISLIAVAGDEGANTGTE